MSDTKRTDVVDIMADTHAELSARMDSIDARVKHIEEGDRVGLIQLLDNPQYIYRAYFILLAAWITIEYIIPRLIRAVQE